jgi:hypothetical protein
MNSHYQGQYQDELKKAKDVLNNNCVGRYTKPSPHLYPHQWNWDSGFISAGYSCYLQEKAQQEILSLFEAQWTNGMVPHIIFNPPSLGSYFPEPDFWQTEKSGFLPHGKITSGITMPPLHATVCRLIYERATDKKGAKSFLKSMYPKLLKSHEYFYTNRDPKNEGLVYIRHPWESGLDNSPVWDAPLKGMKIDRTALPSYQRRDLTKGIPAEQRPTDEDYDRYVFLADLFRRHNYDETAIDGECPFKVQDALFNSILNRSNKDLIFIAAIMSEPLSEIEGWARKTSKAIQGKLWHAEHGIFDNYDLYNDIGIEVETASGFMPLYSGDATEEQAEGLYKYLESASFCAMHQGNCFSIPSYNMAYEGFDPVNYWRGPVWININWMLYQGLKQYGFDRKAMSVMTDILTLVKQYGFCEYFDPFKGIGYGTEDFSWSAALFIDTFYEMYGTR